MRETYSTQDFSRAEQVVILARICAQMRAEAARSSVRVAEAVAQVLYDGARSIREEPRLEPVAAWMCVMGNRVLDKAYAMQSELDREVAGG